MRVPGRVTELGVYPVEHPVGDRVLEHFGLVVHLIPAVAELAHQERLHQPVSAHHRQRRAPAGVGERDRAVFLMIHQPLIGEFADRLRGGAGRYAEALGQQLGGHLLV